MCCKINRGFTLLEVMLAVCITGMIAIGIFGFLNANLRAIQFSSEQSAHDVSMRALMKVLQDQMNEMPSSQPGALLGEAHRFQDLPSDEMQWICSAGLGLFTIHSTGEYHVTLALKPTKEAGVFDLGVRRIIADGSSKEENWMPLMRRIKAMEIRYFDPRINAWLEKWTDFSARPNLVRIRIWRVGEDLAYEQYLNLPLSNGRMGP